MLKDKEELKDSKFKISELKSELSEMKKTQQPRAFSNFRGGSFARDAGQTTHQTRFKKRLRSLGGHTLLTTVDNNSRTDRLETLLRNTP